MTTKYNISDLQSHQWIPVEEAVITFIKKGEQLLLIHKKTGLGKGLINAPGGRIEAGETGVEAARRECKEEVLLNVTDLELAGELIFQFMDGYSLRVQVFLTSHYTGIPGETEEAAPFWCDIEHIPYKKMWADDSLWIPLMLRAIPFKGYFIFDKSNMLDYFIRTKGGNYEMDTENM